MMRLIIFCLHSNREKTRAAIKDTIESNLRDTEVIQKQSAFHHAGASHEHQRIKLDRSAHSKEETIRTKQVQGELHVTINVVL